MNNYRDIIIRPIITEKTMRYMDADNKVTFEVAKGTNKVQIAQAVESIFGVDVEIKEGQQIDLFGENSEN